MIANLYRFLMNWQHIPHIHITYFVFFPVRHKSLLPNECSSIQTLFTKIKKKQTYIEIYVESTHTCTSKIWTKAAVKIK